MAKTIFFDNTTQQHKHNIYKVRLKRSNLRNTTLIQFSCTLRSKQHSTSLVGSTHNRVSTDHCSIINVTLFVDTSFFSSFCSLLLISLFLSYANLFILGFKTFGHCFNALTCLIIRVMTLVRLSFESICSNCIFRNLSTLSYSISLYTLFRFAVAYHTICFLFNCCY